MHLGRRKPNYEYVMGNQELDDADIENDLRIVITSDLKAPQLCSQVHAKANKTLGMINRIITYKSTEVLLCLYKSLVRQHLEYCTAAWSPYYKKTRN